MVHDQKKQSFWTFNNELGLTDCYVICALHLNFDTMPHISVKLWTGKTEAQKKQLAEELTKAAMSVLGGKETSFSVAIEDVAPDDWKEQVYEPDIMEQKEKLYKQPGYKM